MRRLVAALLASAILVPGAGVGPIGGVGPTAGWALAATPTIAAAWRARLGPGGANGTATLRAFTTGAGTLDLALASLRPSATYALAVRRGTCGRPGALLFALPSTTSTADRAIARVIPLSASRVTAVRAAMRAGPIAVRAAAGKSVACGVLADLPTTIRVSISGPTDLLAPGAQRSFAATVTGTPDGAVTWSVASRAGGTVTSAGVYTAPALPGTYTVRATSRVDARASATIRVPVVIPVGHVAGFEVGVDYHATGTDFVRTAFLTRYQDPAVRRLVRAQLQGMADRGATLISTRIWLVKQPGEVTPEAWRATFPLSPQEQANLRAYAQDVAAVRGAAGNRLRLDIGLLWLGAADYLRGTLNGGLGWFALSPATFISRVSTTTDRVLAAVGGVRRPDGLLVVDRIYLDGEVMIGAKANQEWFLTANYPRFVARVRAAGFTPSVYFNASDTAYAYLTPGYTDVDYPVLDGHRAMFWTYRSLRFMADQGLPLPDRVDFSWYVPTTADASSAALLKRVLDDADAVLPTLGLAKSYGIVETFYHPDAERRRELGQAIAAEAARDPRLTRVTFWTTPDSGGTGVHAAYPFAIEDYCPPAP